MLACLGLAGMPTAVQAAEVVAAWDVNGATGYGTSPLAASASSPNVTVGGLTRGAGVVTSTGTAAARGWGGTGWNVTDAAAAIAADKLVSFTVTANAGYKLSFTSVDKLDYRRSSSGAASGVLQYSTGAGFADIAPLSYTATASAGGSVGAIDLTAVAGLQNVPAGTAVTFRIVNFGGSGAAGTWYVYDVGNSTAADLSIMADVIPEGGGGPLPTITTFDPASGLPGATVTITGTNFGASPTVSFNGTPAPGATVNGAGTSISVAVPSGATTGPISISVAGAGSATSVDSFTVLAAPALTLAIDPAILAENASIMGSVSIPAALGSNLTVTLTSSDTSEATVPVSVTIPAGLLDSDPFTIQGVPDSVFDADASVTITASAAGYQNGTKVVTVQNVDTAAELPTTVVVNKYLNGPDIIELLVIGNGTAGSTLDMRGMILKDHSGSMANDGGGKYTFASAPAFEAVKAGTLIVVAATGASADTDGSDFSLVLSLTDTALFTSTGTFDISTTDMISIKASGFSAGGSDGIIHTLAGGAAGTQFNNAPEKKLIATGTTGAGRGVRALNTTGTLADFSGTDAEGNVALTPADFGNGNSSGNIAFIRLLRGITSVDGTGTAAIANGTAASPLNGVNIFRRGSTAQTVSLTLGGSPVGTLRQVRVTVPAEFGVPVQANVNVSGAGAGTPSVIVSGQSVTVSGLAITAADPAVVSIAGLTAPIPSLVTDDGSYPFTVATAGAGGLLEAISSTPVALVTVPISSLRDVDADGVALDAGKLVAVEGVCTEENFGTAGTSGFIQDGDFGINVFSSADVFGMVSGNVYAMSGAITQFNGLTEILPPAATSVVDLGAGTAPAPLVITVPDLLANAEAYEGRLIKVSGLIGTGGSWSPGFTRNAQDGAGNPLDIRIQSGSEATTEPAYPADITGIFGQFDQSAPRTAGYQLMPRKNEDLSGAPIGYDNWAAAYPGIGTADADADGDGASNLLEYALSTIPNSRASVPAPAVTVAVDGTVTVTWNRNGGAAADPVLVWTVEASPTMAALSWTDITSTSQLSATRIIATHSATAEPLHFFRVRVVRTP